MPSKIYKMHCFDSVEAPAIIIFVKRSEVMTIWQMQPLNKKMQEWQNCPKEIVGNDDSPQYMQTRSYSSNDNIYVSTMHKLANWWFVRVPLRYYPTG